MPQLRRTGAAFAAALLTSGLAILSPVLTTSADAAELLVDGGFEAATGSPPVSPGWTVDDSEFDTPICTSEECTAVPPGVEAHTGTGFVWFGGTDTAGHTSSISQAVTIPQGSANLGYWFANPETSDSGQRARLDVTVDGKRLQSIFELDFSASYELFALDISEFADGGSHTLAFEYVNGDMGENSMVVDDISLDAVPGPALIQADADSLGPILDGPEVGCHDLSGPPRDVTFTVTGKVGRPTAVGVRMAFDPEHTYAGDVVAVLIAPDGRTTTIFGQLGDFDDDNSLIGPYLFSDAAPTNPSMEQASLDDPEGIVPPGHYRAFADGNQLITPAFADLGNANGTWTLRLRDVCAADTGSVSAAALLLTTDGVAPADTVAPDTEITTSPKNGIAKSLKVLFGFVSDEVVVTYQCALDQAAFAACANPSTLTVKPGKHTLAVRARDAAGNLDPFPAKTTFTAYDCKSLNADVATLKKKVKALKKAIKKTRTKLAQAIADGDQAEVKELKAKLTKLEKKKHKKTKQLGKAKAAAAPCKA